MNKELVKDFADKIIIRGIKESIEGNLIIWSSQYQEINNQNIRSQLVSELETREEVASVDVYTDEGEYCIDIIFFLDVLEGIDHE